MTARAPRAAMSKLHTLRGLTELFSPNAVAVVGASPKPGSVGGVILNNIKAGGFQRPIYVVHPTATTVHGFAAYPSIAAIKEHVDLAVIVIPAQHVNSVARECGKKGVKGLLVISAGFGEAGPEGTERQAELLQIASEFRMRIVGPNSLGFLTADPTVRLNATFVDTLMDMEPVERGVAVLAQSGALGIAVLDRARDMGLGVARFVSLGNKMDVSGNDLLAFWQDDPGVHSFALYLESIGNPIKFLDVAAKTALKKPILMVKSGRSPEGAHAAASHTGALAEADTLVDALLLQSGVVRVNDVQELLDASVALDCMPLPAVSGRVAIVTNSGGPAIMTTDSLAASGLCLASLSEDTERALKAILPEAAAIHNPVDLLASGNPAGYAGALSAVLQDPKVDAVIVIYTDVMRAASGVDCAAAISAAHKAHPGKPILAVSFGRGTRCDPVTQFFAGVPAYMYPEQAVRALGAMLKIARYRNRDKGTHADLSADLAAARAVIRRANPRPCGWLSMADSLAVFSAVGIPVARHEAVLAAAVGSVDALPEAAAQAAERIGFPVVLKGDVPGLVHKSEAGAVRVHLKNAEAVTAAARDMIAKLASQGLRPESFIVMEHAPQSKPPHGEAPPYTRAGAGSGVEAIIGGVQNPTYGPVVAFGLGGIHVEVLKDVAFRMGPITTPEAERLIKSIRAAALLDGRRGQPPADRKVLHEALVRMSRLMAEFPEVLEAEMNPFTVYGSGGAALDARVRIATGAQGNECGGGEA